MTRPTDPREAAAPSVCSICNHNPATCIGSYDGEPAETPACDSCCGHGTGEGGSCRPSPPVSPPPGAVTEEELEEWSKLEQMAAAGPWEYDGRGYIFRLLGNSMVAEIRGFGSHEPQDENGYFIAAAREALPRLIAEVKRLHKELRFREHDIDILQPSLASADDSLRAARAECERLRGHLAAVLNLPKIAAEFGYLDKGIGTATEEGKTLLAARAALKKEPRSPDPRDRCIAELEASNATLRGALEETAEHLDDEGYPKRAARLRNLLTSTPTAALGRVRSECFEEAAAVIDQFPQLLLPSERQVVQRALRARAAKEATE